MKDWRKPVLIITIMMAAIIVMFVVSGFVEFNFGESGGGAW